MEAAAAAGDPGSPGAGSPLPEAANQRQQPAASGGADAAIAAGAAAEQLQGLRLGSSAQAARPEAAEWSGVVAAAAVEAPAASPEADSQQEKGGEEEEDEENWALLHHFGTMIISQPLNMTVNSTAMLAGVCLGLCIRS